MKRRRWALLLGAAWAGYGWGGQCALPLLSVRRGRPGRGAVALTFDDGPDPDATPRLLSQLAERGARGTFFLIGERAARHPEVVRAIVAQGHEIGNHTWHHRNAWFLTPAATRREILGGMDVIAGLTGQAPRLYRPPWGIVNAAALAVVARSRLTTVLWSLQPEGLRPRSAAQQLEYLRHSLRDGAIVDLHDAPGLPGAPERLLALVPALLDMMTARGLRAVTVSELLAEKAWAGRDQRASMARCREPRAGEERAADENRAGRGHHDPPAGR